MFARLFWWQSFLDIKRNLEIPVVVSSEIYRSSFESFQAGFSKSPSKCWEELFEDILSWNFSCFHIDFQNWAKRFWNSCPKFGRFCQGCIIDSLRKILMIRFFKKVLIFFAFSVFDWNFIWISTVIFPQCCQKCTLRF